MKLGQGYVCVCDSVHGGCLHQCMLGYTPSGADTHTPSPKQTPPPGADTPPPPPTGMHTCLCKHQKVSQFRNLVLQCRTETEATCVHVMFYMNVQLTPANSLKFQKNL